MCCGALHYNPNVFIEEDIFCRVEFLSRLVRVRKDTVDGDLGRLTHSKPSISPSPLPSPLEGEGTKEEGSPLKGEGIKGEGSAIEGEGIKEEGSIVEGEEFQTQEFPMRPEWITVSS